MTQQVGKMSLRNGFPGSSSDLRDYTLLLLLLSPLPASLPPSRTTRTAALPHKSLACSWGKLDTTTVLVPSAVTRTHITKMIITMGEKKIKTKAASELLPCRDALRLISSISFLQLAFILANTLQKNSLLLPSK